MEDGVFLEEGLRSRGVIARRAAPPAPQTVTVGKRVGDMVYELFFTTTEDDAFLVQDIVDLYHGHGSFEGVLADEDVSPGPGPLVFLHALWPRIVADRLSMGMERAVGLGVEPANRSPS
jgi:hypothetical protein